MLFWSLSIEKQFQEKLNKPEFAEQWKQKVAIPEQHESQPKSNVVASTLQHLFYFGIEPRSNVGASTLQHLFYFGIETRWNVGATAILFKLGKARENKNRFNRRKIWVWENQPNNIKFPTKTRFIRLPKYDVNDCLW